MRTLSELALPRAHHDEFSAAYGGELHELSVERVLSTGTGQLSGPAWRSFQRGVRRLANDVCPYVEEDAVQIGWRTYSRPGLSQRAERWPDDWDGQDWMAFVDETSEPLDASAEPAGSPLWVRRRK